MAGCVCGAKGANLGTPSCIDDFGIPLGIAFQSLYNNNVLNGINIDNAIGSTVWSDLLISANKNTRIFPLKNFRQPGQTTEDPQFETANDGYKAWLRDGVMSWTFELWEKDATPKLKGKIDTFKCSGTGVYILTDKGIIGYKLNNGTNNVCAPTPLQALACKFNVRTPSSVNKNMIMFDYVAGLDTANLYFIPWSELNSSLEQTKGIIDALIIPNGTPTVASGVVTVPYYLTTSYASGSLAKNTIFGITTVGNYVVKNVTTNTTITPTTVLEGTDYNLKFTAATAGNVITIELATSSGYEAETVYKFTHP